MRTLFQFTVEPWLPETLAPVKEMAHNLWWTWNSVAIDLFRRMDDELWERTHHNPVQMLGGLSVERLEQLAADRSFVEFMRDVHGEFRRYMSAEAWFQRSHGAVDAPYIVYFTMEFGLAECLRLYSGGLGVLAGDHLKSASDLGLPLVGMGIFFKRGYFRQYLNADGWQQERFPLNDFANLPIRRVTQEDGSPLKVAVTMSGREVAIQVWRCDVGRIALYLLDTNLPENRPEDQDITNQLYGGDQRTRIQQEIVLGIGGMRALHAMGIAPQVCHINEGHAAFSGLERIRTSMIKDGLSFRDARVLKAGGNVFTTHTPVPAGFDLFPVELMREFLADYARELGVPFDDLMRMGRFKPDEPSEPFNMAILALRNSSSTNGVSALHGEVSRRMVAKGYLGFPIDEIPVEHVTNGIHLPSWMSHDLAELLTRYLGPAWRENTADPDGWKRIDKIPNSEIWRTHERRRERLVAFARDRVRAQMVRRGATDAEIVRADEVLDPGALTIGFARRFATYKRATLLFRDPDRLIRILTDPERPVQIIFAGKAHPHDDGGKELIKNIVHFAKDERVRDRVLFIEGYNLNVARYLVRGVDVWLNTPRRPLEASGTSGMKVAANGGLNLSILDGWWAEAYTPEVGWAIGSGEEYDDADYQDEVEANALYDLLEDSVIPCFYNRSRDHLPREWIAKMKASISLLAPFFNTDRMVREYLERFYLPALANAQRLSEDSFARAKALAEWKVHVLKGWSSVALVSAELDGNGRRGLRVGSELDVTAVVHLGSLSPGDVTVELYGGRLNEHRTILDGSGSPMRLAEDLGDGSFRYSGSFTCTSAGNQGLGVRLYPSHPDLASTYEMGLMIWG